MFWKVLVMMNAMPQLLRTTAAPANPLTRMGITSDMMSHGMGPHPMAKPENDNSQ